MFEESEPGKPLNWGCTIYIIITIILFNISIFVFIRLLLESKNEFDQPIIQGEMRENLRNLLNIFALTYCFGCWCCFCCGGHCMRWTSIFHNDNDGRNLVSCWQNMMRHKNIVRPTALRKCFISTSNTENLSHMSGNAMFKDQASETKLNVFYDTREKMGGITFLTNTVDETKQPEKRPKTLNIATKTEGTETNDIPLESIRITQSNLIPKLYERRYSLQNVRNVGALALQTSGKKVAIRGADFVQIPVQMVTPSTIGILDRGYINHGFVDNKLNPNTSSTS